MNGEIENMDFYKLIYLHKMYKFMYVKHEDF